MPVVRMFMKGNYGVNRSKTGKLWIVLMTMAVVSLGASVERPNIVMIFIDDMGYADIGPFGAPY